MRGDDLYTQRLNVRQARLEGESTLLLRGVASHPYTGESAFSTSSAGVLVWQPGKAEASQLTWFDRTGRVLGVTGPPGTWDQIAISPDERQVAAMVMNADIEELGILEVGKSAFLRLRTSAPNRLAVSGCDWLPGGNDILYGETSGSTRVLVQQSAAGGPVRERGPIGDAYLRGISADGKQALLSYNSHLKSFDLSPQGGPPSTEPARGDENYGSLSPDAKWVAYVAPSQRAVFARPLAGLATPRQISNSGGPRPNSHPTWRGDGKEILYIAGDQIWSVMVDLARGQFAAPAPLFQARIGRNTIVSRLLAVTRDGSRILVPVTTDQMGAVVHVMTDWTAALKQQ